MAHLRHEAVVLDDVDRRPGLDPGLLHQDAEVEAQPQHEAGCKFNLKGFNLSLGLRNASLD